VQILTQQKQVVLRDEAFTWRMLTYADVTFFFFTEGACFQVVLRDETFTEGAWDSISGDAGAAALRSPFLGSY